MDLLTGKDFTRADVAAGFHLGKWDQSKTKRGKPKCVLVMVHGFFVAGFFGCRDQGHDAKRDRQLWFFRAQVSGKPVSLG